MFTEDGRPCPHGAVVVGPSGEWNLLDVGPKPIVYLDCNNGRLALFLRKFLLG